ncbi:MAG: PLP-dependent transferase, partial [Planctomycetales bacterium]|nr:PLP-dependent transferase [Planctomycetales bacterium]
AGGAALAVDNTFASPLVCRPLEWGADIVIESVSKSVNGHSDVMLGAVCVPEANWPELPRVVSTWGLAGGPFDCWLALRGLATLQLRTDAACANVQRAAEFLAVHGRAAQVRYPGLATHPDHALAQRQFGQAFGAVVTFDVAGGAQNAERFIAAVADDIPFCPSLGELSTTLSHPASTSHRALSPEQRQRLGISANTIRLSVGVESPEHIQAALERGLSAC